MTDRIPLIPEVPGALREAAQIGKLVPFVGAGASVLAGCPNWVDFADRCFDTFLEQGKFSYSQLEQIRSLNTRVKLSIALDLQDDLKLNLEFYFLV
jgi:hypothetical protein